MENDSVILGRLEELEKEVAALATRLQPALFISTPTADVGSTQPARSPLAERIVSLTNQLRELQSRLEL